MSYRRLLNRVPQATKVGLGILRGHRLLFHKRGRDSSAKCDAFHTGKTTDKVYGVVYRLKPDCQGLLHEFEGLGKGYDLATARVQLFEGSTTKSVEVFYYQATDIDPMLKPFRWYKVHVLRGAIENRLPEDYCHKINAVPAILDPNRMRTIEELSIYWRKNQMHSHKILASQGQ